MEAWGEVGTTFPYRVGGGDIGGWVATSAGREIEGGGSGGGGMSRFGTPTVGPAAGGPGVSQTVEIRPLLPFYRSIVVVFDMRAGQGVERQ